MWLDVAWFSWVGLGVAGCGWIWCLLLLRAAAAASEVVAIKKKVYKLVHFTL